MAERLGHSDTRMTLDTYSHILPTIQTEAASAIDDYCSVRLVYNLCDQWEQITQEIKADIKVLDMPLLDTMQFKDTLGTFVSDLVLQVLSFVAERERETILQRQKEGIAVAKAKGKHLGRPKMNLITFSKEQRIILEILYTEWNAENITAVQFMNQLDLKKNTFYKIIHEYENQL